MKDWLHRNAWFILVFASVAGCAQTQPPTNPLDYSLSKWQERKTAEGGHYAYDSTFLSYFGFGSITTIEVQNDAVVKRSFLAFDEQGVKTEEWTEQGTEVGSHELGEPARTVEEVYEVCRRDILSQDPDENAIKLLFGNDLLEYCAYIPLNCADDCAVDVAIENLRFLGKPE